MIHVVCCTEDLNTTAQVQFGAINVVVVTDPEVGRCVPFCCFSIQPSVDCLSEGKYMGCVS